MLKDTAVKPDESDEEQSLGLGLRRSVDSDKCRRGRTSKRVASSIVLQNSERILSLLIIVCTSLETMKHGNQREKAQKERDSHTHTHPHTHKHTHTQDITLSWARDGL